LGTKNVKIVFHVYLHQNWIDLRQIKTKMIIGPFYNIVRYIQPAIMLRFCDNL